MLGARLRWLEAVQEQPTESWSLPLHTDGANVFIDVGDRRVRVRDPYVDYVLILCDTPAPAGGESIICDGYRVVKRIREHVPDLYEFLTTVEVERESRLETPRLACMVEWTRRGRMVMRADPWARPYRRELHRETHGRLLGRYADLLATLAAQAPDTLLAPGEILMLDNYRCPHGIRAHEGYRRTRVLRCKSADAL